ncbi:hypothetical protein RJ55_08410 [Drechmeria coniospora]|nr:hypothetical protein RJ55_08410 [Drechmeria coniospora]
MPGLFARLRGRDGHRSKKKSANDDAVDSLPRQSKWSEAYTRTTVEPEEVHELLHCCTEELKARGLDLPFLLLPFRPTSDPSAVRSFIRHFFERGYTLEGDALLQEVRMAEPMVIADVAKWCWGRLQGGVVGWDAYELFKVGELDSNRARDSFRTFIPISVENVARQRIIFDFFDLIAAVAAHGKSNGFGGLQLSRMAGWWAFEQKDTGSGFDGGYKAWLMAADATSHLFFAYLRSLSPEHSPTGISLLPRSLEKLLKETKYPPSRYHGTASSTNKLVMMVDAVSPTPFALLRRAGHFQYRDSDRGLQMFSNFEDPVQTLTDECRRVLNAISAANQSSASSIAHSTSLRDASWSRFEDMGFGIAAEDDEETRNMPSMPPPRGIRSSPVSRNQFARPTTPSWADFLSSGFVDETAGRTGLILPPDQVLPPIETQIRQHINQSQLAQLESDHGLEPGELASITLIELDDSFWWVWMSSLAPEETVTRKSAFGRCAVIETRIPGARWIVVEELIAGAAPEPEEGAYIAEKKSFFSWTKRSRANGRNKPESRQGQGQGGDGNGNGNGFGDSKTSIGSQTHAKIQAKAAQLRATKYQEEQAAAVGTPRRGRHDAELLAEKTNSVFSIQTHIVGAASPAMKWVKKYDKVATKDAYLANSNAGRGASVSPAYSARTFGSSSLSSRTTNGGSYLEHTPPTVPLKEFSESGTAFFGSPRQPHRSSPKLGSQPRDSQSPVTDKSVESKYQKHPSPPPATGVNDVYDFSDMTADEQAEAGLGLSHAQQGQFQANKEKSGLRRLLTSRKNRDSTLPDEPAADINEFLRSDPQSPEYGAQQALTSSPSAGDSPVPSLTQKPSKLARRPVSSAKPPKPSKRPESTVHTSARGGDISPIDTQDAADAAREFSQFDQGPLRDQPAFAPEDDDFESTTPTRIPRRTNRQTAASASAKSKEQLNQAAGPGVQDRWAQIRKNAAARASTRGEHDTPTRSALGKAGHAHDGNSGEETIETRVARIKARVAELTVNMEDSTGPQLVAPTRR